MEELLNILHFSAARLQRGKDGQPGSDGSGLSQQAPAEASQVALAAPPTPTRPVAGAWVNVLAALVTMLGAAVALVVFLV